METQKRVQQHYSYVESLGYDIIGVFLVGSQNYKLDHEGSDVDTKAIIMPNLTDVVQNKELVSTTLKMPNGEQIDVKDVRLMFENFKKQNINYLEVLFTDYFVLNRKYAEVFTPIFAAREDIARYDYEASLNCIAGMALGEANMLKRSTPSTEEEIAKHGYSGKRLHNVLRMSDFIERFIEGESFENCLVPKKVEELKRLKTECYLSLDEAVKLNKEHSLKTYNLKNSFLDNNNIEKNIHAEMVMNYVLYEVFCIALGIEGGRLI